MHIDIDDLSNALVKPKILPSKISELKPLSKDVTHVLSKPTLERLGATGYVQDVFISEQPNLSDAKVYACGSADMIQRATSVLIKHGLPKK